MARQFDNLFPDIIEFENLLVAYRFAAKGKRCRAAAESFEYALGDELITLRDELASKSYRPGGYYSFRIRDPKPRLISAAPFRDRVVHPVKTGIPFLGFRTYPERRQLKRRNGVNFERRLHRLYNDYENGDLTRMELAHRIQGWVAHANGGDTWGLQKRLLLRPLPQQHPDGVTSREPPL